VFRLALYFFVDGRTDHIGKIVIHDDIRDTRCFLLISVSQHA